MKRIISLLTAMSLLLSLAAVARAEQTGVRQSVDFAEWKIEKGIAETDDSSSAAVAEGMLTMSCDTQSEAKTATVKYAMPEFLYSGEAIETEFKFVLKGSDNSKISRQLRLGWSNEPTAAIPGDLVSLIAFQGSGVKVGTGTVDGVTLENDRQYSARLLINPVEKTVSAWLDDRQIADNAAIRTGKMNVDEPLYMRMVFSNSYPKIQAQSDFCISEYCMNNTGELLVATDDVDGGIYTGSGAMRISYGAPLAQKPELTLMCGEEKQEITETFGYSYSDIKFSPTEGVQYTLEISGLTMLSGQAAEDSKIEFSVLPEGYVIPELAIDVGDKVKTGIETEIAVRVTNGAAVDSVEITADGEALDAAEKDGVYTAKWTPKNAGKCEIYAQAYSGAIKGSARRSITVTESLKPTVEFVNLTDTVSFAESFKVTVNAEDTDGGISEVVLYKNGREVARLNAAPYEFDVPVDALGEITLLATAVDNDGVTASAEKKVAVVRSEKKQLYSWDFNSSEGTMPILAGTEIIDTFRNRGAGLVEAREIDEEHGYSLLMDNSDATAVNAGVLSWRVLSTGFKESDAVVTLKFETLISNKDIKCNVMTRGTKADGESYMTNVSVEDGNLVLRNGTQGKVSVPYETGKWYTVEYTTNLKEQKYSVSVDGIDITDGGFAFCESSRYTSIRDHIRFDAYGGAGYIAIDNMTVSVMKNTPAITSITDDDGNTAVRYDTSAIYLNLSGALGTLSTDDFVLSGMFGEEKLAAAELGEDNTVKLTPAKPLEPSCDYTVTIKASAQLADGGTMGYDTKADFRTAASEFDVTDGSLALDENVNFTANIANTSGTEKKVAAIVILYAVDGRIAGVYCREQTMSISGRISVSAAAPGGVYSAKAYVVDGISGRSPVSNKIFTVSVR